MKLPDNIIAELNLPFSRHQQPELLDWQLERGKWTATNGTQKFIVLHDDTLGYVIAEMKGVSYGIGALLTLAGYRLNNHDKSCTEIKW